MAGHMTRSLQLPSLQGASSDECVAGVAGIHIDIGEKILQLFSIEERPTSWSMKKLSNFFEKGMEKNRKAFVYTLTF